MIFVKCRESHDFAKMQCFCRVNVILNYLITNYSLNVIELQIQLQLTIKYN